MMLEAWELEKLEALGQNILVCDMVFNERMNSGGIILLNDDGKLSGIRPRWAKIYAIGPDQRDPNLVPGKWVFIEHGRWSRGIKIKDSTGEKVIRKADPTALLLISDTEQFDDTMGDKV